MKKIATAVIVLFAGVGIYVVGHLGYFWYLLSNVQ